MARPPWSGVENQEVLAFVVSTAVLIEGRCVLGELDRMGLSGNDPVTVPVERLSNEPVSVALVRLRSTKPGNLPWIS